MVSPAGKIVHGRAFGGETARLVADGEIIDARGGEGEIGHDGDGAGFRLDDLYFVGLREAVAIEIGPDEQGGIAGGVAEGIEAGGPERFELRRLEDAPIIGAAHGGDGDGDIGAIDPEEADSGAAGGIAVIGIGEIALAGGRRSWPAHQAIDRGFGRAGAFRDGERLRFRAVEDARDLGLARLPIEGELHAVIVEAVFILRIELPAAAVFGGAVEAVQELAIERPDADALGLEIRLGDPEALLANRS